MQNPKYFIFFFLNKNFFKIIKIIGLNQQIEQMKNQIDELINQKIFSENQFNEEKNNYEKNIENLNNKLIHNQTKLEEANEQVFI